MPVPLLHAIDWSKIARAVEFYNTRGYVHVEVPWEVSEAIVRATAPAHAVATATAGGYLVGSGEQGLLALAKQGLLAPGKYQTTTPCFRQDAVTEFHGKHFVKVELMVLKSDPTPADRDAVIADAKAFFNLYVPTTLWPSNDEVPYQVDIEHRSIELGSYGLRRDGDVHWVYGTGCAEPRLSAAMSWVDPMPPAAA